MNKYASSDKDGYAFVFIILLTRITISLRFTENNKYHLVSSTPNKEQLVVCSCYLFSVMCNCQNVM